MKYVYGPAKFAETVRRKCGEVEVLENMEEVLEIPQGAILYVNSLRRATKIKIKAPWIRVRVGFAEVTGVKLRQLDVYELMREVMQGGTCDVYVPDPTARQALSMLTNYASDPTARLSMLTANFDCTDNSVKIRFNEKCGPTYRCSELATYLRTLNSYWKSFWSSYVARFYNARLPDIGAHMKLELPLDAGISLKMMEPKMTAVCTTVGTPYADVEWNYYLDYPPGVSPEELAALLREKKLLFQKAVAKIKLLKRPCR